MPFGYCKYTHLEVSKDIPYVENDNVYYFGTWTPKIEECLVPLQDFNLHIEGNLWQNSTSKKLQNASISSTKDERMSVMARKAGVVVNFTRALHGCFHTMKTFELPISRTAIVTNWSAEQEEFLKPNIDCLYYDSIKDIYTKTTEL